MIPNSLFMGKDHILIGLAEVVELGVIKLSVPVYKVSDAYFDCSIWFVINTLRISLNIGIRKVISMQ